MGLTSATWLGLSSLLCFAAAPVSAQNLVVNGRFDTDLSSWTSLGSGAGSDGSRGWNPIDMGGSPGSGSALFTLSDSAPPGTVIGLTQCVVVSAGQTYNYGARILTPTGQPAGQVRALVEVAFSVSPGCVTPSTLGEGQGILVGMAYPLDDGVWHALPGTAPGTPGSILAPLGAISAEVRVFVERVSGNSVQETNFDGVFFNDDATGPVSLMSFTVE